MSPPRTPRPGGGEGTTEMPSAASAGLERSRKCPGGARGARGSGLAWPGLAFPFLRVRRAPVAAARPAGPKGTRPAAPSRPVAAGRALRTSWRGAASWARARRTMLLQGRGWSPSPSRGGSLTLPKARTARTGRGH